MYLHLKIMVTSFPCVHLPVFGESQHRELELLSHRIIEMGVLASPSLPVALNTLGCDLFNLAGLLSLPSCVYCFFFFLEVERRGEELAVIFAV